MGSAAERHPNESIDAPQPAEGLPMKNMACRSLVVALVFVGLPALGSLLFQLLLQVLFVCGLFYQPKFKYDSDVCFAIEYPPPLKVLVLILVTWPCVCWLWAVWWMGMQSRQQTERPWINASIWSALLAASAEVAWVLLLAANRLASGCRLADEPGLATNSCASIEYPSVLSAAYCFLCLWLVALPAFEAVCWVHSEQQRMQGMTSRQARHGDHQFKESSGFQSFAIAV